MLQFPRYAVAALLAGAMVARANQGFEANNPQAEAAVPSDTNLLGDADPGSRRLASSSSYLLTFEGVGNGALVADYYNGVRGPDYGVVFGSTVFSAVDTDEGGQGPIANEPSPSTIVGIYDVTLTGNYSLGSFLTVKDGFTGFSFFYSLAAPVSVSVYSGPARTGTVLANLAITPTGVCGVGGVPACGDPTGVVGIWNPFTVPFSGVARSVGFSGAADFLSTLALDDVSIIPCTTYWLYDAATKALVGEIENDSLVCFPRKYNIRVSPCFDPGTKPVKMVLKASKGGVVRRTTDNSAPYSLYGPNTKPSVLRPSPEPLKPGTYTLSSNVGGAVTFTNGKLGKKGCKK